MARQFTSASSQYMDYAGAVTTSMPLTMACWFYPDTTQNAVVMALNDNTVNTFRFMMELRTAGTVLRALHNDGTTSTATSTTSYTTSAWNHGVSVFTSTTSRTIYLNGGGSATDTTSRPNSMSSLNRTTIGRNSISTPTGYFNGRIAEAAIWGTDLTADEAISLSKGFSPLLIRPTSLLAYWPLFGRFTPEIDLHGRFDLSNTGSTTADHVFVLNPAAPFTTQPPAVAEDESVHLAMTRRLLPFAAPGYRRADGDTYWRPNRLTVPELEFPSVELRPLIIPVRAPGPRRAAMAAYWIENGLFVPPDQVATVKFRKTLSGIGTRVGSRQVIGV